MDPQPTRGDPGARAGTPGAGAAAPAGARGSPRCPAGTARGRPHRGAAPRPGQQRLPPMSPPDRRRRRAHRSTVVTLVAAALVVAVLIGGALRIGGASGPYWGAIDRSYAGQGKVLVDRSNRAAAQLGYVLGKMTGQSRTLVQSELDLLVRTTADTAAAAAALEPPPPWGGLGSGFAGALADRARAVARLRRTVDGLLGMGPAPADTTTSATAGPVLSSGSAATDLSGVGVLLERADRSYAQVRRAFRHAPGRARLPLSRWVRDPGYWAAGPVATMVDQLLGSAALAPVHRVVLVPDAVSITPAVVPQTPAAPSATSKLPPTRSVTVTAVVANRGNVAEHHLVVTAAVRPLDGGSAAQRTTTVSLAPGRSVAVLLAPLPVAPGHSYDLTVSVAPPTGQAPGPSTTLTFPVQVHSAYSPPPTTTTTTAPKTPHRTTTTAAPKTPHRTTTTTAAPKAAHRSHSGG